ncbi:MAG: hypothetical protein QW366_03770 [Sulfolobales archaeon]
MSSRDQKESDVLMSILIIYLLIITIRSANASFIFSLTKSYELKALEQGIIQGSYSLSEALSGFLAGVLYEYIGSVRIMFLATLILMLSYTTSQTIFLGGFNPIYLIAPQIISGFSASLIIVSSIGLLADKTIGFSFRGRLLGAGGLETSNLAGYAIGFIVAGVLEIFKPDILKGFMIPLAFISIAFIASIISLRLIALGEVRRYIEKKFYIERRTLSLIPMWTGISIILGVAFISPRIIERIIGSSIAGSGAHGIALGHVFVIAIALLSLGIIGGSYLSSFIGRTRTLLVGSLSAPLLLLVLGYRFPELLTIGSLSELLRIQNIPLFLSIAILGLLSLTLPPTLLALLADYTDATRLRGPSSGIYVTTLGLGIFAGNILGGYMFDHYGFLNTMLVLALLFTPLGLLTYIMVMRSSEKRINIDRRS